jgi:SAM-dependent methyltransferase
VTAGSVVFDRAASFYDQTRALPDETARAQTELLAAELVGAGPVVEMGVGTGRIAVPLARAGLSIAGMDLSAPMLAELVAKNSAVAPVLASGTALPVRTGSVGAVIACHVLHLITDWQAAAAEAVRVLRPGGKLLATRGRSDGPRSGPGPELMRRLHAATGAGQRRYRGLEDFAELDRFLAASGAQVRLLPGIANPAARTAAEFLGTVGRNTYSWTWHVPPDRLQAAVAETLGWVQQAYGDPALLMIPASPVQWRSYQLPA